MWLLFEYDYVCYLIIGGVVFFISWTIFFKV